MKMKEFGPGGGDVPGAPLVALRNMCVCVCVYVYSGGSRIPQRGHQSQRRETGGANLLVDFFFKTA